ncbi:ACP S-malonyltransferase [Tumebacillus permanentifrigoris]|uniref:[acyl-carrier-protein] S-malonyltransferase n=1 Tax=Tumebacillus permanentifrigoris TaxID=378543 RepID=A0A316DBP2_9BACL|nr:ACP S-malonyltransferase [Tumebacillus permanentifrigoris]PWK14996.1 trans-AT polyketide synthase/acyltransferase/oxidoreductase domain-containing protein [Tumebacillus permanentifrigoris]
MSPTIVFMYAGQGSQYYQMGKSLYEEQPVFQSWMKRMDQIVQSLIGTSVLDELYNPLHTVSQPFQRTLHTHIAIFMVEVALTQVLLEHGIVPQVVIGASLGEFAASVTAGVWDVEEGLHAVVEQARLLEAYCEEGSMLAVLHHQSIYRSNPVIYNNCDLASVNHDEHFIVSGPAAKMVLVEQALKSRGVNGLRLPVTQGFHSTAIDPAAGVYKAFLEKQRFHKPKIPFVSSLTGQEVQQFDPDYFWRVIREPIQFAEAVSYVHDRERDCVYLDLGPSGTLINLLKKIKSEIGTDVAHPIITPFQQNRNILDKLITQYASEEKTVKEESKHMLAFVFPGQGSQKKGMGGDLFDKFPDITSQADAILGYSIKELCLHDPHDQLGQTQFTQPALYTVCSLMYLDAIQETGIKPDVIAGHSVGEYSALFAAGAFDFATGLKLVQKRGELMSQAFGGGMAAVVGLDEQGIQALLAEHQLDGIDIANFNTPKQLVISGRKEDIDRANPLFKAVPGIAYIPLKVSGAFHSRYMSEAQGQFATHIQSAKFSELQIPVLANVTARPYRFEEIQSNLVKQITHSVKWCETIQVLMGFENIEIKEIGPGKVLAGLLKKTVAEAQPIYITLEDKASEQAPAAATIFAADPQPEPSVETVPVQHFEAVPVQHFEAAPVQSFEPVPVHNFEPAPADTYEPVPVHNFEPVPVHTFEPPTAQESRQLAAESLGSQAFKQDYQVKYAYMSGAMSMGIASKELVVRMGRAGLLGFLGTGGVELWQTEEAIRYIQRELAAGQAYGMNLLHTPKQPEREEQHVDLYLQYGVRNLEASAFMSMTPALIKYRAHGLAMENGRVVAHNRIIAKVSRPEVAENFLSPAPDYIVEKMVDQRKITREQAHMLKQIPMADDLCLEGDSGGHTDGGNAFVIMPSITKLRDEMMAKYGYHKQVRVGVAGGIGTPDAAAAAFVLGADFILTGSINQCTVEAGTSNAVKDLLQQINIQDTAYAPAGDMFELGARIQVMKKGVFFPARAKKLHELYLQHQSLDEINEKDKKQIQEKYFKRTFDDLYAELKRTLPQPEVEKAESNPKHKMALLFKWYFNYSARIALQGEQDKQVDFQIHCGPALGAFNQWVKGTELENWRNRHCDEIGIKLMTETAKLLQHKMQQFA